jgi:hypothetical protein
MLRLPELAYFGLVVAPTLSTHGSSESRELGLLRTQTSLNSESPS